MKKLLKKLHGIKKIFRKKQKISPKRILMVLIPCILIIAVVVLSQSGLPLGELTAYTSKAAKESATPSKSSYLTYDKAVFATLDSEGEIVFHENNSSFIRGESIHFALMNVGEFKVDEEGKNWVDIDMVVIGPDKEEIMNQENLLGNGGHLTLENNTAPSPSGVFKAGNDMKDGKYTIKVKVYDKIGGGEVSDSGSFELK